MGGTAVRNPQRQRALAGAQSRDVKFIMPTLRHVLAGRPFVSGFPGENG